jgi:hypothetical protein
MPRSTLRDDADHWRRRAREARALAEHLEDPPAKTTMLEIAESYERLAMLVEKRARSKK